MEEILGTIYTEVSENFQRGIYPISRTVKAEKHDLAVVLQLRGADAEVKQIGNMDNDRENFDNPSDRAVGSPTEQRLEPNSQGICNTLTSVQKDNLVIENIVIGGEQKNQAVKKDGICTCLTSSMGTGGGYVPMVLPQYRIRKLTPLECWRLMGFSDEDFRWAEKVNSNSQLYKQAGNSIVKNVLMAIFGQMLSRKEKQ